jgi:hypothetical protein
LGGLGIIFASLAPLEGYNFRIYRAVATYYASSGQVPPPELVLTSEGLAGSYADFPALSLWVYRFLFETASPATVWLWCVVQIAPVVVAALALSVRGQRIGISRVPGRAAALTAIVFASALAAPKEDKTYFFWLMIGALFAYGTNRVLGSAVIGLFSGWSGLAVLAPLLPGTRNGLSVRWRLFLTAVAAAAAVLALFAAGTETVDLLRNRSAIESRDPYLFSLWLLAGPLANPQIRAGFLLVGAALCLVAYRRHAWSLPATMVAMATVTLLSSNNTYAQRILMLLPLGVLLIPQRRWQLIYLGGLFLWFAPFVAREITPFGLSSNVPPDNQLLYLLSVLWTNAPLLLLLILWSRGTLRRWRGQVSGQPDELAPRIA